MAELLAWVNDERDKAQLHPLMIIVFFVVVFLEIHPFQDGKLVFFLRSLAEQVRRLEMKVERERIVLAALPNLSLQIVEFAREHGRVTIGDAIKLTGVSRNTLKQHFRNLDERGHLNQQGSGRGVWYELK